MFADNDLFVDDDNADNHLDFLRQIRKEKVTQPYQQNRVEQDLKVENEDDDFSYHFAKTKNQKEEEPQKLEDLLNDNNQSSQNDFYTQNKNNRLSKGRVTQSQAGFNKGSQNLDNFLYQSTNFNNDNGYSNGQNQRYSNADNGERNDNWQDSNGDSRPVTANSRPTTSTSLNARARLAQQQKARLNQAQTNNTEGTLVSNLMLRTSKTGNLYENSNIEFTKSQTSDFFYDPTIKNMDKSGLPELQKTNHIISYKANEIDVKQSVFIDYQEQEAKESKPEKADSPKEQYKALEESSKFNATSNMNEEEKDTVSEIGDRESSDDEGPTKEDLKTLEKQKKELNKQQDAEIGIVRGGDQENSETQSKILHIDVSKITDMKAFLTTPCPKGYRIECTIKRDKSGMGRFYPKYHCYLSHGPQYLMSGKKRAHNATSNYLISYNKNEIKKNSPFCLGKLRSNFLGTEFNIFDQGQNPGKTRDIEKLRSHLGVVLYESNLLSAKGPRKMRVLVPEIKENTNEFYQFKPLSEREGLLNNFKAGNKKGIKEFQNKNPKWNDQLQAFVLNFNGRVEKPSVKNFQLIDERNDEKIFLQFGRVTNDTFNMDFEWPLSPFQAFAICLSSFDYKIACE